MEQVNYQQLERGYSNTAELKLEMGKIALGERLLQWLWPESKQTTEGKVQKR